MTLGQLEKNSGFIKDAWNARPKKTILETIVPEIHGDMKKYRKAAKQYNKAQTGYMKAEVKYAQGKANKKIVGKHELARRKAILKQRKKELKQLKKMKGERAKAIFSGDWKRTKEGIGKVTSAGSKVLRRAGEERHVTQSSRFLPLQFLFFSTPLQAFF